jgi:prepilin-type N-terminal cleavage/methylation domain-containing protein
MRRPSGFTLLELLITSAIFVIAAVSLLFTLFTQLAVSEHARNLSWAANDAARVMERLRRQNTGSGCDDPDVSPPTSPVSYATWDAWLADPAGGGGKSITPQSDELIIEPMTSGTDPLQVTVGVCWRNRGRTIGECNQAGPLAKVDLNGDGAFTYPVMLSTMITCRK